MQLDVAGTEKNQKLERCTSPPFALPTLDAIAVRVEGRGNLWKPVEGKNYCSPVFLSGNILHWDLGFWNFLGIWSLELEVWPSPVLHRAIPRHSAANRV